MNTHIRSNDFDQPQTKPRLFRMLGRIIVAIFSSPKGDHGGWDGGARGLSNLIAADLHEVSVPDQPEFAQSFKILAALEGEWAVTSEAQSRL